MSDEDEKEIVVKIDDQSDPAGAVQPEADQNTKGSGDSALDSAVSDLAKQYKELEEREEATRQAKEAAQRRAEESERAAQEALREAEAAKAQARNSNLDTINTALASANAEVEAAKRDIKIAGEAGDYEAQAAAYERLASAKALTLRYDEAKADLEAAKPEPARRKEPEQPTRPADPVEAYVAGRSAPTEKWLRAHPEFITDRRKNARLNAAHFNAVAEGCEVDTDAYFSHVEKFLGLGDAKPNGVKKPAARTVAPTSAATGSATSGNEVRLTPGEARSATDGTHTWGPHDLAAGRIKDKSLIGTAIGVQEMARRKLALQKQGMYDRSYEVQ